jgi:hypothetical protein
MKSRMEELSDFYDANIDDPKAFLIEKMRLRLKKALMYKASVNNHDVSHVISDCHQQTSNSFVS